MGWASQYSNTDLIWLSIGFLGQAAFTSRFLIQWLASERKRDSVVPTAFWWLSLAGGLTLLTYAVFFLRDPVIIVGQSTGAFIYSRNLYLIAVGKRRKESEPNAAEQMLPPGVHAHQAEYSKSMHQGVRNYSRSLTGRNGE